MQSTNVGSKISKPLHNITDSAREVAESLGSELGIDNPSQIPSKVGQWFQSNYGKVLGFVGVAALVGTVVFFVNKNNKGSSSSLSQSKVA